MIVLSEGIGSFGTISVEEFFKIEDEDLKKFIYQRGLISGKSSIKKIDNDEKIGYYLIHTGVHRGASGNFYSKNILYEWLVYNKKTKKVKFSKQMASVRKAFVNEYFTSDGEVFLTKFSRRNSPTFFKRIFEGKINTVKDLLIYIRSYVLRNKQLSLTSIYNFMLDDKENLLHCVEDPDELESLKQLNDIPTDISLYRAFKFKIKDNGQSDAGERIDKWVSDQNQKLDTFFRQRNGQTGSTDVYKSSGEISDLPY